jgi:NADPH-dependent 2,4-dienoyl-CoA reductase/sulfur reductase-like enzyme
MASYDYLIVGGGMTADAAARGIRERDPKGSIGIIGADPHPPYNRPPLTKGLWKGEAPDSIWRKTDEAGVELHLGRRARTVDAASRQVGDDRGATYEYRRLLLAPAASRVGSRARPRGSSTSAPSTTTARRGSSRIRAPASPSWAADSSARRSRRRSGCRGAR